MRQSAFLVPALVLATSLGSVNAQNVASVADREIVRRQEDLLVADKLIAKGDKAVADKEYEAAYVNYLDALDRIPAGAASGGLYSSTLDKFSSASIAYAEHLIATGRYSDAEKVAKTVLLPRYNPTYKPAVKLLSNLEQADYYNKTVTPASAAATEEVTKLLYEADGFYQTGRYDLAMKRYEQVLNIDRYNIAARKGQEQVNAQKSKYYKNAYNETRSRMLWEVDQSWERPIRRFENGRSTSTGPVNRTGIRGTEAIVAKLNRIIIPRIDLQEATVRDAVDFLKQRSRDLDMTADGTADKKGVNIVLKLENAAAVPAPDPNAPVDPNAPAATVGGNENTRITLALTNVPLIEALKYLTELSGLKYKIDPYAVSIVPLSENTTDLVTKEYRVPPGFIPNDSAASSSEPTAGAVTADMGTSKIGGKADAKAYLEKSGVPFPPGAFAKYVPAGSKLIVRNIPDAIDLVDFIVDAAVGVQPTQVEIESKFLEITQNNLKELGFDWLMGPLSLGGGVYGAGGTVGYGNNANRTSVNGTSYPFTTGGVPVGAAGGTGGGYPLTAALRSGIGTSPRSAVSANSIDALLAGIVPGSNFAAPAIFGVSGIFTNPQFQVVIRALDQRKGIDLMSAPKVTTKSGHKAIVRVVREFPYPTEFNPPEPPPPQQGTTSGGAASRPIGSIITQGVVTPTTPTAFETRNLGVTLEVEPVVGPDGYTIDLNLSPEVVEFDGFVNYGSPILGAQYNFLTNTITQPVVTDNVINQPIFSTRKVTTSVSIWDGQTVALGGLIREDVQKVQDKVPLLGDVPIAGRLFRTNVDQKIKRNLIIFVTARLMDAEGRPVRMEDETEEITEPLGLPAEIPPPVFDLGKGSPGK